MKNLLSRPLLLTQTLHLLIENVSSVILTLFIWQTASINSVILFRLFELIAIPFGSLIGGYIIDRISPKLSFYLGVLLLIVLLLVTFIHKDSIADWIFWLGLISGSSAVLRGMSLSIMTQQTISQEQQSEFFSTLTSISKVISIFFPLVTGLIIGGLGYAPIFGVAIVLAFATLGATNYVLNLQISNQFTPLEIYKNWTVNKTSIFLTNFVWGIEFGLLGVALPIVITLVLKSESAWGMFMAFLSIMAILYAQFLKKITSPRPLFNLFGFVLSLSAVLYATNFNLLTFVLFMVILQFWQVTQQVSLVPVINGLIRNDKKFEALTTEYAEFMELPFTIGRFCGLVVLLGISTQLHNPVVVGFLFALLGLIPLYETRALAISERRAKTSPKKTDTVEITPKVQ